ncbi:probable peptide/nitrate transporter At3g43790 isoform X2 [Aristolochia californica]
MIRDFHIAKKDQDIGYYAGYVGSSFMFGRALTSFFWGLVADRYGRKPVIMLGTISVVVFNTLFGLSTNFWMAIATRFLLGSANGLLGPIKAYAIEVCRKEHQPIGLSVVSTSWGIGLIIGPALGGFLAQPAEKYPKIFSQNSLFGKFPYLLPCFCISLFAIGVTISCLWLPETLHKHNGLKKEECDSSDDIEATSNHSGLKEYVQVSKEKEVSSNESLLKNWPLMSSIIVYCIFSLQDMAYTEIFSLWAVSNRDYGGLSFSTEDVGQVLAVSGFGLLVFQLSLYPTVERLIGHVNVSRLAAVLSIPLLQSYPFIALLSGLSLSLVINCASVLKNVLSVSVITGLFLLQNNAVAQHQRGAANGISMTAMSLFKAAGPAGGGALFALAQKRQEASFLPGDQLVFFVLNLVGFLGILCTFKPFLALPKE